MGHVHGPPRSPRSSSRRACNSISCTLRARIDSISSRSRLMLSSRLALAAAIACIPVPAFAADAAVDAADTMLSGAAAAPTPGSAEEAHHEHGDDDGEVIVTGVRRRAEDVLGGISVLDAADLTREVRPSIGETLARQPGVSATSFGPAASAPVLRGLIGRSRARAHRRHRQPRPFVVGPRPRDRDQSGYRGAHRGASRTGGAAVRLLGDRRRGQRHRHAHSAQRARRMP